MERSGAKWQVIGMFMGTYNHSLDTKGRIIVPAKFRETLGDSFVISPGLDGCLFAYPKEEWEKFAEQLAVLPGNKDARRLQRHFMGGADTCEVDKQGRTLIPAKLREVAGLEKDVVLVGVMQKIEIWSKEKWEDIDNYEDVDEIAEHMAEFGISF